MFLSVIEVQSYSFENVPQLHRSSANGMKLSEFVGLVNVSIAVDLKALKTLQRGINRGSI
jgi:hypothetical protein